MMSSWFCTHEWNILQKTVRLPVGFERIENIESEDLIRLTSGATNVLVVCKLCGKTKLYKMNGLPEQIITQHAIIKHG